MRVTPVLKGTDRSERPPAAPRVVDLGGSPVKATIDPEAKAPPPSGGHKVPPAPGTRKVKGDESQ